MAGRPEGLLYQPDFLTVDEEQDLVSTFEDLTFSEVRMHGQPARRTVAHFGVRYDYESYRLTPTDPLPAELEWLRDRAAALAEVPPEAVAETLVTRYPAGAGIGWHRDAPMFGPRVVGVSLLSPCRIRFQRGKGEVRQVFDLELEPRSAYVIGGAARSAWQHSIPSTKGLRYSVTFRTVRKPKGARSSLVFV